MNSKKTRKTEGYLQENGVACFVYSLAWMLSFPCIGRTLPVHNSFKLLQNMTNLHFRHSFGRYPILSQLAFGKFHGCFEKPDENKEPLKNIDCPDVIPLKFSDRKPDREAMRNDSPLVHPDAQGLTKYCLGTGLQMRDDKKSHKLQTCQFHNARNSTQGRLLKTMTQEAMQVI